MAVIADMSGGGLGQETLYQPRYLTGRGNGTRSLFYFFLRRILSNYPISLEEDKLLSDMRSTVNCF